MTNPKPPESVVEGVQEDLDGGEPTFPSDVVAGLLTEITRLRAEVKVQTYRAQKFCDAYNVLVDRFQIARKGLGRLANTEGRGVHLHRDDGTWILKEEVEKSAAETLKRLEQADE